MRDLRYALRTLRRSPGFTLAAIFGIALGIGANTAVFSVVNGVLLRRLPYADSDRLVMVFDSFSQQGIGFGPAGIADFPDWKARSQGDARALISSVRGEIRTLDPDVPVTQTGTMAEALFDSVSIPRFRWLLMTVFAAAALLLAAAGIYGVVAYSVSQRVHEIGVRMALGATAACVLRLVVGQDARLTLHGIALGLTGAVGLAGVLRNMLFGVTTTDPHTFACVVLLMSASAILASLIPAHRAAKVDLVTALRHE